MARCCNAGARDAGSVRMSDRLGRMPFHARFHAFRAALGVSIATGAVTAAGASPATPSASSSLPAAAVLLIAAGFASIGMAFTSYMKTFQQMDWLPMVMLPMFLFSATFYPITVYPEGIQIMIQSFPLWHGVELIRMLTTGVVTPAIGVHIAYYVVMLAVGVVVVSRRLRKLFLN